jgi:hypothetical protein
VTQDLPGEQDLTDAEARVWRAVQTGEIVDLRSGDAEVDRPERGDEWEARRTVRAEILSQLLIGSGDAPRAHPKGVRLRGARISGQLDLEVATLRCPLALLDCCVEEVVILADATAPAVRLSGSRLPGLQARHLVTHGDLRLDGGVTATGEVRLFRAHIGGILDCRGSTFVNESGRALTADGLTVNGGVFLREGFAARGEVGLVSARISGVLDCSGGRFSNDSGPALSADGLTVDGDMFLGERFEARGEVRMMRAHVSGQLGCSGTFANPSGRALTADGLTVGGDMFCREGFEARGEVRMMGAHISGQLDCSGGTFANPRGRALTADGLAVDRGMFCRERFEAQGEVRLVRAHITRQLDCSGGTFANESGSAPALNADGLTVGGDMFCREGFEARGEVRLLGAHISGQLDCTGGSFANGSGHALDLEGATVTGSLYLQPAMLNGGIDLTNAQVRAYVDDRRTWPQILLLEGFTYSSIKAFPWITVKDRLAWLGRNARGFSPQPYDQLASVYRRAGREGDARRVAIARRRRRRLDLRLVSRVVDCLADLTVGYGYSIWRIWFLGVPFLAALATVIFTIGYPTGFKASKAIETHAEFHPLLYAVDILLPVVNLHERESWAPTGGMAWVVAAFTLVGWVLGTAALLSLTGILKKGESGSS